MASANVLEFTDSNFDSQVLSSPTPVVVDFWATWCQPCLMLSPVIDAIAAEFAGRVKVGKVDIDTNRQVASLHQINSIPTILIFKNGQVIKRFVGLTKKDHLVAAIAQALEAAA
ncbi:MAG: thioredoxin [Phycisphaerales bacterium]